MICQQFDCTESDGLFTPQSNLSFTNVRIWIFFRTRYTRVHLLRQILSDSKWELMWVAFGHKKLEKCHSFEIESKFGYRQVSEVYLMQLCNESWVKSRSPQKHTQGIEISSSFWYMIETWPNLAHRKKIGFWEYPHWIPVGTRAYVLLLHKCVPLSEPHWVTPWTHKFFYGLILIKFQTYIKMKNLFLFLVYVFGMISIRLNFYYITT